MYLLFILSAATFALAKIDPAKDQIVEFKKKHRDPVGIVTTSNGAPVYYNEFTSSLNTKLVYNSNFMENVNHLVRERTPERLVHGKGAGAFGYFEVTNDITHICKADFLKKVGEKTPIAVRFSQSIGERGFIDLNRGTRGFATKFYTKEGNLDIAGFNTEIYFYKDPLYFNIFVHAFRRNPATNLMDSNTVWDAISLRPEAASVFLIAYADRGIPASYRNMPGFGNHLFKVENDAGEFSYVKFHILPDAGVKNLRSEEAKNITVDDPDYLTGDLFRAIAKGDYPSWTMHVQILTDKDVKKLGPRAWDVTRSISTIDFPLNKVGKLVLNRNPKNFFAEIEQLAFCPSNLVPGILGSPDKIYESRILAYRDAHMYRLGVNVNKIPVNCPYRVKTHTYYRDGIPPVNDNEGDMPNYYPNSFNGPVPVSKNKTLITDVEEVDKVDNFDQAADFYDSLKEDEKTRLVDNLVNDLSKVTEEIQQRMIDIFTTIHCDLGDRVNEGLRSSNCEDA